MISCQNQMRRVQVRVTPPSLTGAAYAGLPQAVPRYARLMPPYDEAESVATKEPAPILLLLLVVRTNQNRSVSNSLGDPAVDFPRSTIVQHRPPSPRGDTHWFEITMAVALLMHVRDSRDDLTEEMPCLFL